LQRNPLQESVPVETVMVAAEPVVLDQRKKGRRGAVFLAIERIVARESIAADEQERKPLGSMLLTKLRLPVQHGEMCMLHRGDFFIVDHLISEKTWTWSIPGQTRVQDFAPEADALVDVNEGMRRMRRRTEFHRMAVNVAPRIIDGARLEECIAIEPRRLGCTQPFWLPLGVALKNINDGRHVCLCYVTKMRMRV